MMTAIAAALVLIVPGCGGGERPGVEESADIGFTLEPPTLDLTANAAAAIPQVLLYNVYEGLVKINDDGEIVPLLTKSWEESDDGRTYTFHLREDAKFSDGKPFTADDVEFSINRVLAPKSAHPHKAQMEVVKSVEKIDDHTVRIHLKQPSRNWLFRMGDSVGVMLNEDAVKTIATSPVGTGPFVFKSWRRGCCITLERNEDYWGEKAPLKTVTFRYFEDPNALNNALLAGDIDLISNVAAPELLDQFKQKDQFEVIEGLTNGEVLLTMNNARKPLNDVRVRRAITYAINREQLVETAYAGFGKLIGSHASPGDPWFIDLSETYAYDPEKAKKLLAEAGFPNGFTLSLKLPPPNYARSGGQFVASQLQEVGIRTRIQNVEWPVWLEQVFSKGDYDLTIVAHVEARDIDKYGNPDYYWRYDNPKAQKLLAQADATTDKEKSNELYQQVQRIIAEDAVNDWLFLLPFLQVATKEIDGFPKNAFSLSYDVTDLHWTS